MVYITYPLTRKPFVLEIYGQCLGMNYLVLKFNLIMKNKATRTNTSPLHQKGFDILWVGMKIGQTASGGQWPSLYQAGSGQVRFIDYIGKLNFFLKSLFNSKDRLNSLSLKFKN